MSALDERERILLQDFAKFASEVLSGSFNLPEGLLARYNELAHLRNASRRGQETEEGTT